MEAKDSIVKILRSLAEIEMPVTRQPFIDYLTGKETREITEARWDEKETFGCGESYDEDYWTMVLDAAFERGLLKVKNARRKDFTATAAGKKFLRTPESFDIKDEGEMDDVPQENGLDEIVKTAVSAKTPVRKTTSLRTKQQMNLIHAIDCKIALDDFAESESLGFDELLDEVEAIVYSGTKLNIDYFLEEVMDDDHVDDIYDYFAESETDSLETAIQELGDDYSEDEIRLVRIKFISEMAN